MYVLLLEKISSLHKGVFDNPISSESVNGSDGTDKFCKSLQNWISIGHFDAIHAFYLNSDEIGLFEAIHRFNRSLSILKFKFLDSHFHALYLIPEENCCPFENIKRNFMAVARIHLNDSINVNNSYRILYKKLKNVLDDKGDIEWMHFRTMELSDMILLIRSDRLRSLLDVTLLLRRYKEVGKVYTYYGVDLEKMKDPSTLRFQSGDNLPFCSIRFSLNNVVNMKKNINNVKGQFEDNDIYSVIGVDDIACFGKNIATKNLVELYQRLFFEKRTEEEKDRIPCDWFSAITTRVGISQKKLIPEDRKYTKTNTQKILQSGCNELIELSQKILVQAQNQNDLMFGWVYPLVELTISMKKMGQTVILDEFIYLMYTGSRAFLQNVEARFDELSEKDIIACRTFVEDWGHLMEHIMRLEGQLSQYPEVRPMLYDIPAAMLEYTLAYLDKVASVLQSVDENSQERIQFLLIPRMCPRIEAQELYAYDSIGELPGLVLISLPLQTLYDPEEVQFSLCHEVSHFAGEKIRNREFRHGNFIEASAILVVRSIFGTLDCSIISTLCDYLKREIPYPVNSAKHPEVLAEIYTAIITKVKECVDSDELFAEFINTVVRNCSQRVYVEINKNKISNSYSIVEDLLYNLYILYRESYADLCMLSLLELDSKTYIESFTKKRQPLSEYEAIRIYCSLQAVEREIPDSYLKQQAPLGRIAIDMKTDVESDDRLIPAAVIKCLIEYLQECHMFMQENLLQKKIVSELREMYMNVGNLAGKYEEFLEYIDTFRRNTLRMIIDSH